MLTRLLMMLGALAQSGHLGAQASWMLAGLLFALPATQRRMESRRSWVCALE